MSEPFALAGDTETAVSEAASRSTAAADAKSARAKSADAKAAEDAARTARAQRAGRTAPAATVPEPSDAEAAPPQTGPSALLAAAIAGQADASAKPETGQADQKDEAKSGDQAISAIIDLAAMAATAALSAEAAKAIATTASTGASATAQAPGQISLDATNAASASEAATAIAAAIDTSILQKGFATTSLASADKANGEDVGKGDPTAMAGHLATHALKAGANEPAAIAAPAEFKISELLQPLQGAIDLSAALAQTRSTASNMSVVGTTPEQAAAQAAGAQAQNPTSPPTPLHVVPIEIGLRALAGGRKFDIRLDPAELGRVDVSLDISDKGEVTAKLVVDRVETLHMLQRDARTLERAFEQAGLKPSNAGVEITLRDPGDQSSFRQSRQQDDAPRRRSAATDGGDDIGIAAQPLQSTTIRGLIRLGGVDLSI